MSAQFSVSYTLATMQSAQTYLYRFVCSVIMLFGTIGGIINIIVFTQKTLRKNPCSLYFIAYNLANIFYIHSSLLSITLNVGYSVDASTSSLVVCRLRLYSIILFNVLSPFYLILAAIDRVFVTSSNARTRQRSTRRFAYICIIVGTIFWSVFHIHALISSTIIQLAPKSFLCYFAPGVHLIFVSYYSLIKETMSLVLLIVCGLWAIKNIQKTRQIRGGDRQSISRTTAETRPSAGASKDRQLILMLMMDILIYALFSFVFVIFIMYQQITQNNLKSYEQVQIENIIRNLCLFCAGVPFCTSCYANLFASKTFRAEVKKIVS